MSLITAVPVKDLANAKQRLVAFLGASERRDLARVMLEDVLDALAVAQIGQVLVVTREPEVEELAARHSAGTLREEINLGHTEAVAHAQRSALARGATRFLTIPGDVPCVTPAELRSLAETPMEPAGVVFVPSLSGFGTNAALLAPPDIMPLKFGEPSFDNHLVAARAAGLRPLVRRLPGLGLDIDAPDDLGQLLERGPSTRSAALLVSLDVPARLARHGREA